MSVIWQVQEDLHLSNPNTITIAAWFLSILTGDIYRIWKPFKSSFRVDFNWFITRIVYSISPIRIVKYYWYPTPIDDDTLLMYADNNP
jgi:hypothetical protein